MQKYVVDFWQGMFLSVVAIGLNFPKDSETFARNISIYIYFCVQAHSKLTTEIILGLTRYPCIQKRGSKGGIFGKSVKRGFLVWKKG